MHWKLNTPYIIAVSGLFLSVPLAIPQEEAGLSIQYGNVTAVYSVDFNDPKLPSGVLRGIAPRALTAGDRQSSIIRDDTNTDSIARDDTGNGVAPATSPALLYSVDLGDLGLIQVVTAQNSVLAGECAAVEQWGSRTNLRRINAHFCLPENRALATSLAFEMRSDAKRCFDALDDMLANGSEPLQQNYVDMVCDG